MLYSIELGNESNLDQILRVNKRIFKSLKKADLVSRRFYESILKKKNLILLVKEGKMVVGDAIAVVRGKNYHVLVTALNVDQIKHGVALKLLNMHKQLAKDNGFKGVSLTVYDSQKDLIKIVEQEGFSVYRKNLQEGFKDYKIEF